MCGRSGSAPEAKASSFSEEKEAKRLLPIWLPGGGRRRDAIGESSLVLSFKKEHFFNLRL
jgi:hypothetical protein